MNDGSTMRRKTALILELCREVLTADSRACHAEYEVEQMRAKVEQLRGERDEARDQVESLRAEVKRLRAELDMAEKDRLEINSVLAAVLAQCGDQHVPFRTLIDLPSQPVVIWDEDLLTQDLIVRLKPAGGE